MGIGLTPISTGRVVTSTYDALNRLGALAETGHTTLYAYDLHGNTVTKTLPNGEKVTTTYDALNRAIAIRADQPNTWALYSYEVSFDLTGNVVWVEEWYPDSVYPWQFTARHITMGYDEANRLISEQYEDDRPNGQDHGGNRQVTHAYDAADNRTAQTTHYTGDPGPADDTLAFTYNDLNQLTELVISKPVRSWRPAVYQTNTYTYDLNGNRATRSDGTHTTTCAYDYDNRLLGVAVPGQPTYAYTYDYRTRRVEIAADPGGGGSVNTTALCFSGGTSVFEKENGALSVEYLRGSDLGGGVGGILYTVRGTLVSNNHYNARGDVYIKTNAAGGAVTYTATYEAFGTRYEEAGSTADRQKANTKDEDPTGLLNEGFRYRDLETGAFITRDPIGFTDGPNLYTYVHQNPWTHFDPEGLAVEPQVIPFNPAGIKEHFDNSLSYGGSWYSRERASGRSAGGAAFLGAVAAVTRFSGALGFAEALGGDRVVQTPEGGLKREHVSGGARIQLGVESAVQLVATVLGGEGLAAKGSRAAVPGATTARVTRYMGEGELAEANRTGNIPNYDQHGIPRPTHDTTDKPLESASEAQKAYELPQKPTHSATVPESRVKNLGPAPDGRPLTSGGGSQKATSEPIPVKPNEIKKLKD